MLYTFTEDDKEHKTPEEIDAGFDYIEEFAPRSHAKNAQLRWITKQSHDIDSPVFGWPAGTIKDAISSNRNESNLAKTQINYPICLGDLSAWFREEVRLYKFIDHSTRASNPNLKEGRRKREEGDFAAHEIRDGNTQFEISEIIAVHKCFHSFSRCTTNRNRHDHDEIPVISVTQKRVYSFVRRRRNRGGDGHEEI